MGRITSKDKWELIKNKQHCFHCRKEIVDGISIYVISQSNTTDFRVMCFKGTGIHKQLLFHSDCFEEVAGEDYCFSEE